MKFFKTTFANNLVAVGMFPDHITTDRVYHDLKRLLTPIEFESITSISVISEREYIHTVLVQNIQARSQYTPN